jgi:secreted Zn-dependent insulinase-like peptidase
MWRGAVEVCRPPPDRAALRNPVIRSDVGIVAADAAAACPVRVCRNLASMTILEKLRSDHQDLLSLLATIMAASAEQERNILFKQFLHEFIAHSRAEESQLYERLHTYEDS